MNLTDLRPGAGAIYPIHIPYSYRLLGFLFSVPQSSGLTDRYYTHSTIPLQAGNANNHTFQINVETVWK